MTVNTPTFSAFYNHHPVNITCDSGATSSLIKYSFAKRIDLPISETSHTASQADGKTKLHACGETHVVLARGDIKFTLQAVVVKELDCDILAGMPFMRDNNIILDIPHDRIILFNKHMIDYSTKDDTHMTSAQIRRAQSFLLRAQQSQVVLPGDYLELPAPELLDDVEVAVEPRCDSQSPDWPSPSITEVVGGFIRIPNNSADPICIKRNQHVAQVRYTCHAVESVAPCSSPRNHKSKPPSIPFSPTDINIDPQVPKSDVKAFESLHEKYKCVFNPNIGKYNDQSGRVRASINFGSVEPPPQKGRLPMYTRENMVELQDKMDELEDLGVLAKPEDVGVSVDYVSPSFLVRKPDGGSRLVTAFNGIASYAKPFPSRSTTCDDVFRFLAKGKFMIKTDMTKQFFQLPMKKASMKYLGVQTPYKGIRVYTRAAMGMPGSTEHLDELMHRVLGDLFYEGVVLKIADDLYIIGDDIPSVTHTWERVLIKFAENNLRLSAKKTSICPTSTVVLGWNWTSGSIAVSPHKVSPLVMCPPPSTVKGLRSWCGAYKHIKACIPSYSILLADLEAATAGRDTRERITWTDTLSQSFKKAQNALRDLKSITIPKPSDQLIITVDGALRNGGIGSVLYILRDSKMLIGGYFSSRLHVHQRKWLPCEVEALAIASAVNHWGPSILQSELRTQILSDSKPCIQAMEKLKRGEFSASARVSTFLSTLSRYSVYLHHISGNANIPADFNSRHPNECDNHDCQICQFVADADQATVRGVTVSEVLDGSVTMPFMNHSAWKKIQQDCPALRRTCAHLSQGTRPPKQRRNAKDIKRYLQVVTLSTNGLLVVRSTVPFAAVRDLIVVPQQIVHGLLTAIHLRFQHPSRCQLKKLFHKYFYALNADTEIDVVSSQCAQCASLAKLPREVMDYTTSQVPSCPGKHFACDIMCRARQKIFVIRDCFSSYTIAMIIPNEQSSSIRNAMIELTAELLSPNGATIRADGATPMQALQADRILAKYGISVEIGRVKNPNKNPVAEKAIQELQYELKRSYPDGGPLTSHGLAVAVASLNARLRNTGLSAKELLFQRDNITGEQLKFQDTHLADIKHDTRRSNHLPSARSKAPKGKPASQASVKPGDLVYVKNDGNKHTSRDRYIVVSCDSESGLINIQRLGHQLRSKSYQVKPSEIFIVPYSLDPPRLHASTRSDPYQTDSSSDGEQNVNPFREIPDQAAAIPELPDLGNQENENAAAVVPVLPDNARTSPYPRRNRIPPTWLTSESWDLS